MDDRFSVGRHRPPPENGTNRSTVEIWRRQIALSVQRTVFGRDGDGHVARAQRIRAHRLYDPGEVSVLGEVPMQSATLLPVSISVLKFLIHSQILKPRDETRRNV